MIKGPIKITIEGAQGSGKTQIADFIRRLLDEKQLSFASFAENATIIDIGQRITIVEKN